MRQENPDLANQWADEFLNPDDIQRVAKEVRRLTTGNKKGPA